MPEILLINPSPRPSKRKAAKKKTGKTGAKTMAKRRTAAQKAATRKLIAFNKARKHTNAKRAGAKRRRNPMPAVAAMNPIKKRRKSSGYSVRHVVRRRRRNPINLKPMTILKPAVTQAMGGVTVSFAMSYLTGFLPASMQSGYAKNAVELIAAVGLGMIGSKVVKRETAHQLAVGAATITMYNLAKSLINQAAPSIGSRLSGDSMDWELEGLGWANPAMTYQTTDAYQGDMGEIYTPMGEIYDQNAY